jgi:hypothetical protein
MRKSMRPSHGTQAAPTDLLLGRYGVTEKWFWVVGCASPVTHRALGDWLVTHLPGLTRVYRVNQRQDIQKQAVPDPNK